MRRAICVCFLLRKPTLGQISPCGVRAFNQCNPLFAIPSLDLLLTCDGLSDVNKRFEMNKPMNPISQREPGNESPFVLHYPPE